MCPVVRYDARPVELTRCPADQGVSSRRGSRPATRSRRSRICSSREYGTKILAAPPKKGFNLLAWLLPFVALFGGAIVLGLLAWRWSHTREPGPPAAQLSPALERRVDEELARFDEG